MIIHSSIYLFADVQRNKKNCIHMNYRKTVVKWEYGWQTIFNMQQYFAMVLTHTTHMYETHFSRPRRH